MKKSSSNKKSFFSLLESQCTYMCKAMEKLNQYCITHDESCADEVVKLEDEADMVRRVLIDEINKTFITPIDREDLFRLSSQIDEITDYAKTSVDEIRLFNVIPDSDMEHITKTLCEMCEHIYKAVVNIEHHQAISRDEAIKVKELENTVGQQCCESLAKLFDNEDFRKIFKYREIYRHLNHTADIGDMSMDYLLDILVKM